MRSLSALLALSLVASQARAQASVASDLWRVADGTLVIPAALAADGSAPLWTPAVVLQPGQRYRIGVDAIHAPSEIGISGGVAAFTARVTGLGYVSLTYGHLGIGNTGYTETSPELVGSELSIYNQTASVGVARTLARGLTGGLAARYLSGQLGFSSRSQFGLDLGVQYAGVKHLRLGATTHFFDPLFTSASQAASYSFGAEARSSTFSAWGTRGSVALRYGITAAHGDDNEQLVTAGVTLGTTLSVDGGAARQHTPAESVWRSRLGVAVTSGNFTMRIARDGGVNDFGATYRFGLTAGFR